MYMYWPVRSMYISRFPIHPSKIALRKSNIPYAFWSERSLFILGVLIAAVPTLFLILLTETRPEFMLVSFSLTFVAAFLSIYVTLEFLVFREVNQIYEFLERVLEQHLRFLASGYLRLLIH